MLRSRVGESYLWIPVRTWELCLIRRGQNTLGAESGVEGGPEDDVGQRERREERLGPASGLDRSLERGRVGCKSVVWLEARCRLGPSRRLGSAAASISLKGPWSRIRWVSIGDLFWILLEVRCHL